jgi:hypothetical protein
MQIDKSSEQNFYKPFVAYDPPFKATVLKDFKPIKKILPRRLCSHTKSRKFCLFRKVAGCSWPVPFMQQGWQANGGFTATCLIGTPQNWRVCSGILIS